MTEISEVSSGNSDTSGQGAMNQQQQQQQQQQHNSDGRPTHGANSVGQPHQQQQSPQQQNAHQQQQQAQQHLVNAAGQTIVSHAPSLANQSFITNTLGHNLSSPIYLQPSPLQYIYQLAPNMLANIPLQTGNNTLLQLPNTSSVTLPAANTGRQQNITSRGVAMSPQQPSISTTAQGQTIGGFKTPDNSRLKFAPSPIASSSPILIPHGTALQMAPAGSCILPNNQKLPDQRGKIVLQQTPQQIQPKSSMLSSHGPSSLISTNLKPMTSSSMIHSQQSPLMNNQIPIMVGSPRIQLIQPNQLNQMNQPDSFVIQSPLGPAQIYLNPGLPVMNNQGGPIISLATSQSHTATNNTVLTNATQGMTGQMIAPIPTSVPLSIHSNAPISTQSLAVAPPPSTVSTTTRPRQIKPAQVQASVGTQTAGGTSGSNTSTHSSATTTTPTPKSGHAKTTKNAKLPFKSQADRAQQSLYRQISPSQGSVPAGQGSQTVNVHAFPNQSHIPPNSQISSSTGLPSNSITSPHISHSNPTESRPHPQMNKDNNVTVTLVSQSPMNPDGGLVTQRPPKTVPISRDVSVETSKMAGTKTKEAGTNKAPGERLRGRPPTNKFPSNGLKERNQAKQKDIESRDAFAGDNMEIVNNFVDPIRENGMYMNREHFIPPINKPSELSNGVSKEVGPKLPQKAIVKPFLNDPNVLTHVIDGYVIQESPSPFPPMDHNNGTSENSVVDGKDEATEDESTITDANDASLSSSTAKPKSDSSCENCGKVGIGKVGKGGKKKKPRRFCSKLCALKFNDSKKSQKLATEAQNISNTRESEPSTDYPMDDTEGLYIPAGGNNPLLWNVQDVCDFVRNLPGCQEYADEFKSHEIDGQALMLLKEDHLMNTMSMKLGPALKICNRITALFKAESSKSQA